MSKLTEAISFKLTQDLSKSAAITYDNMRSYYEHYGVGWQESKILEQIVDLDNWDILCDGQLIGALRLSFDADSCWLRDLQIIKDFQNKGIGGAVLAEAKRRAEESGAYRLMLKVFKISPAYRLYDKFGFTLTNEDDRFYYMELDVIKKS